MSGALDEQARKSKQTPLWKPTEDSLNRLLRFLDGGVDSHGRKYEEMRKRLIVYFDRKNCQTPEELADKTLDRVTKWLEQSGKEYDDEPAKICYNTARFVFHEYRRQPDLENEPWDDILADGQRINDARLRAIIEDEQDLKEKRTNCLEQCTQQLPSSDQDLILRYYYGEKRIKLENRKALAIEHRMTANALNIKACRIRTRLKDCVSNCLAV